MIPAWDPKQIFKSLGGPWEVSGVALGSLSEDLRISGSSARSKGSSEIAEAATAILLNWNATKPINANITIDAIKSCIRQWIRVLGASARAGNLSRPLSYNTVRPQTAKVCWRWFWSHIKCDWIKLNSYQMKLTFQLISHGINIRIPVDLIWLINSVIGWLLNT